MRASTIFGLFSLISIMIICLCGYGIFKVYFPSTRDLKTKVECQKKCAPYVSSVFSSNQCLCLMNRVILELDAKTD